MAKKHMTNEELVKEIEEAMKDPEFRKGVDEFIRFHTGRSPS